MEETRMSHMEEIRMSHMIRYNRVGSKKQYHPYSSSSCQGFRGFRLNPRRFSVQRLRTKFMCLIKVLNQWRKSYGQALQSLKRNLSRSSTKNRRKNHSYGCAAAKEEVSDCRGLRSFARTNSFYSEAIADCLDFIKRNSLSLEENPGMINER